jgi:hypothetical protein
MNPVTDSSNNVPLTQADYTHSIKVGVVMGFAVGVLLGLAMIVYINSPQLYSRWPEILSIPILNGLGWALFGMIVGGGGLLAHIGRRDEEHAETVDMPRAAGTVR